MEQESLNILLYCNRPPEDADANTIIDHIDAFVNYSKHHVFILSCVKVYPLELDLTKFDVIIVHYSSPLFGNRYIPPIAKERIRDFKGLKILFIQDEYRKIDKIYQAINYLQFDILYTCIPTENIQKIYPDDKVPNLTKINTLTGYVPERLLNLQVPAIKDRPIDVSYRARKLPYWYGKLAVEKWEIADKFLQHTKDSGLNSDISYQESKRIYGPQWLAFVGQSKAMLGVESGASVMDFTGEIEYQADKYQIMHPNTTFTEIQEKFLQPYDGKIKINQISPRCFEATALKTALVLYEGEYSGILQPERHYIPLKKDFSNIKEVVVRLKDHAFLEALTERAYAEIALNDKYSYKTFIADFDSIVTKEFYARNYKSVLSPYDLAGFDIIANKLTQSQKLKVFKHNMVSKIWRYTPEKIRAYFRVILRKFI